MFAWIAENTAWMYWTLPSAIAFITLFNVLVGMTVWEILSPTVARRGFFPIETTRGDRLFIGIMSMIIIFLLWLAFVGDKNLAVPTTISAVWFLIESLWG